MSSEQTKLTQAQNSVEAAANAVGQVQDHPSKLMEGQAERSIRHAQAAVEQAEQVSTDAAEGLSAQLDQEGAALDGSSEG